MGLFNKKNPYEKDALDLETAMRDTPERPDLRSRPQNMPQQQQSQPMAATQASPMQHAQAPTPAVNAAPPPASQATPPKLTYGIEDAIKLMRELPDHKKEMVITIVQKTLISAKINVSSIIEDAGRKIDRLEKKNDKLGTEIRELEEAIAQRKTEMEKNERDVSETRDVKLCFESAPESRQALSTSAPSPYTPSQKAG